MAISDLLHVLSLLFLYGLHASSDLHTIDTQHCYRPEILIHPEEPALAHVGVRRASNESFIFQACQRCSDKDAISSPALFFHITNVSRRSCYQQVGGLNEGTNQHARSPKK